MSDVDMITITIGGNDAGFADVLQKCVFKNPFNLGNCDRGDLPVDYGDIPTRLAALLAELKRVAPDASIFVLGYPHLTPEPIEVNRTLIDYCGLPGNPMHATGVTTNPVTAVIHERFGGTIADAAVSYSEARFLHDVAKELNAALRSTASAAGVHFVDVVGLSASMRSRVGFAGHSPCSSEP